MRARVISDALNVNGTLSNLDVSDNRFSYIGAAYLSEALRVSRVKPVTRGVHGVRTRALAAPHWTQRSAF